MNDDTRRSDRHALGDEQLDAVIDAVAREMISAEPPAHLRADVLARIERDRRRPWRVVPAWAWTGAAAVAVLTIATSLWFARPQPAPEQNAAATAASSPSEKPRSEAALGGLVEATAVAGDDGGPAPGERRPAARAAREVAAEHVGLAEDVGPAPLAAPSPIEIAPLGPDAIAIPELGITQLGDIQPITVLPVGPGSPEPQRRERE